MLIKLDSSSPNFRGENKKYLSCHHLVILYMGGFLKWWVSPTNPWAFPPRSSFFPGRLYHLGIGTSLAPAAASEALQKKPPDQWLNPWNPGIFFWGGRKPNPGFNKKFNKKFFNLMDQKVQKVVQFWKQHPKVLFKKLEHQIFHRSIGLVPPGFLKGEMFLLVFWGSVGPKKSQSSQ